MGTDRVTMRSVFLLSLFALAVAQGPPRWFDQLAGYLNALDDTIDQIHGFRIEYHHGANQEHLMIGIKDMPPKECHFVEVSPLWEHLLQNQTKVQKMTEEVYHLMVDPNYPETELTLDQLKAIYNDPEAVDEFSDHALFVMNYRPSNEIING